MSKITLEFKLSNPLTKDEREGLVHSATWLMRLAGHECVLAEPPAVTPKAESPKKRKAKKKPAPPVTLEMPAVDAPDSGAPMPVVEVPEIPAAPMPPAPPVSAQPAPDAVIPTSEDLAFPALAEIVMTALNNNDLENLDVVNTVTSFGLQSFADLTGRPDLVNPVADKIKALIATRKAEA